MNYISKNFVLSTIMKKILEIRNIYKVRYMATYEGGGS